MKMPSKNQVKIFVQSFLLVYMSTMGFIYTYMLIWYKTGMPLGMFGIPVSVVLGLLSTFGLFHWIVRGK